MKRLLFIDDDQDFLEGNRLYFTRKGYEVFCRADPAKALNELSSVELDCIILDIDMPEINGYEVCQRLRENRGIPVIFLSGMSDTQSRINSFRAGGDDFLAKPYDIVELELRIEARIRKSEKVFYSAPLQYGLLSIDTDQRVITYDGKAGDFSSLQFDILTFMARNPGKVFSYEQLYDRVWRTPLAGSRHNLQVAIATIRQKLTKLCDGKQYIRTVSRKGYCFMPDQTAE